MKFGLPTLVECKGIDECSALAGELNLSFIEINMSFPQYQVGALDKKHLKDLMEKYGIFYTIHADEQLNPFDFNSSVSECYFEIMRGYIRFAKELHIPVINMHLLKGVYVTLPGEVILLTDVYKSEYLSRVSEFIKMCEDEIADSGVVIAIENVDSNAFTSSQLLALDLFMMSDAFALTFDVGHDHCLSHVDGAVYEKYPEKLKHMHLHDARGKSAHLPLGSAEVDVASMLRKLKFGDTCLVEVKTVAGLRDSVKWLKSKELFT